MLLLGTHLLIKHISQWHGAFLGSGSVKKERPSWFKIRFLAIQPPGTLAYFFSIFSPDSASPPFFVSLLFSIVYSLPTAS